MSPTTVDRLKSLPLTIVLTILIWMYAEAKFTATGEARVPLRPVVPNGDLSVRVFDNTEGRFVSVINIVASLQGPTNQITALQQETEPPQLTFSPPASMLVPGTTASVDTVPMLNSSPYLHKHGLTVTSANPGKLRLEVDRLEQVSRPVVFHPPVAVDHVSGIPDQVTLAIPSKTLQEIGGAEKDQNQRRARAKSFHAADRSAAEGDDALCAGIFRTERRPGARDACPDGGDAHRRQAREAVTQLVPDVPVWVSGPPALLARFDVDLRPKFVPVIVSGTDPAIQALKTKLASSPRGTGGGDQGIHAYLDVSLDDRPTTPYLRRPLRYVLPDGLSVQDAPGDVEFRLVQVGSPSSTAPSPSGR